ncbi:MAG: ABC transporter substrate-binding protein, partial [Rhodospirillaceae bacterium]|nr:ABC transporter substrate-binding protein [Rhodospirillaceae bacterium]
MKQLVRFLALGLPCAALVYAAVPAAAETTLRIGTTAFPQARGNPFVGVSLPSTLPWSAVFDTLTRLDDQGRAAPGLALDWRTEDERTWVFTLREGVTFHNGEPLTAAAVVNAVRYLGSRDGQTRTLGALLRAVKRAEARDDRTVAI